MRTVKTLLLFLALTIVGFSRQRISGYCQNGNTVVNTLTAASTNVVQGSFPSCTVTVTINGGGQGIVNTSGTAVTLVSGTFFVSTGTWNGLTMTINGTPFTLASCASATACTLTSSAGTQTSVSYGVNNAPAAIFSDNFGTVLANPFTASSTGAWGFFADDGAYDVQFSGAGIGSPFTITANGAFDGTPVPQGTTGTISRFIKSKLADVVSAKDFGCVGNGATDDTNCVNLAIAVSVVGKGSTPSVCVNFPDGIYRVTSAIVATHPVCLFGTQWRIKYTAATMIPAVFSLVGGAASQPHGTFMEGGFISGMIVDGQGNATDGLILQGVVSGQMNYIRATNVVDVGISCNWCQQVTFEHNMVSSNFEAYTTVPQRCFVIDGISSDNVVNAINCEHVSGTGIDVRYAFGTHFNGGTSEGNGGVGVRIVGSGGSNFAQNISNLFTDMDLEVNTGGDILIGDQGFFNTFIDTASFSIPGVTLTSTAHNNTFIGGYIGSGSTAGASTIGNQFVNVSCIDLTGTPVFVDSGFNRVDNGIYNQGTNARTPNANQYNNVSSLSWGATNRKVAFQTAFTDGSGNILPTLASVLVGDQTVDWIGFETVQGRTQGSIVYPLTGGMAFTSATSPATGEAADGAIVNHQWCFGLFCVAPAYKYHFFDALVTTLGIQAGAGQGGADLSKYINNAGTQLSGVSFDGKWSGPVQVAGAVATVSGCGASSVTGGSTGGAFTVTTTGACSATITMGGSSVTATHSWSCSANNATTANLLRAIPTSPTQVTLAGVTVSGDTLTFACTAY